MKILFAADVHPDPNSGAAGTEYQTLQALKCLGHEVDEIWQNDLPHQINHGNLHYLLELPSAYLEAINKRWKDKDYDVVHVNQAQCFLAAADHRRRNRPGVFIYRSHGLEDRAEAVMGQFRKLLKVPKRKLSMALPGFFMDALLMRHYRKAAVDSSGVIVSSNLDKKHLVENYSVESGRVAVIPQAAPDSYINEIVPLFTAQRLKKILHIGNFVIWKGSHAIVKAITQLLEKHQEASFTWVCSESDHSRIKGVFPPGVVERVCLRGWGSQNELRSVYDENGVLLCPSIFEGFGKVFMEGLSRGLCVVGTPTGGMKDIIEDGRNGLIVNFNDHTGIVNSIGNLWKNDAFADIISKHAILTARQYSWDRTARETLIFYQELLDERRRGQDV